MIYIYIYISQREKEQLKKYCEYHDDNCIILDSNHDNVRHVFGFRNASQHSKNSITKTVNKTTTKKQMKYIAMLMSFVVKTMAI